MLINRWTLTFYTKTVYKKTQKNRPISKSTLPVLIFISLHPLGRQSTWKSMLIYCSTSISEGRNEKGSHSWLREMVTARDKRLMDTGWLLAVPPKIAVTILTSDLVLWSDAKHTVYFIELTDVWEDTVHTVKKRKGKAYLKNWWNLVASNPRIQCWANWKRCGHSQRNSGEVGAHLTSPVTCLPSLFNNNSWETACKSLRHALAVITDVV